ncbi:MAG: Na+/H+ antiporter [Blastocatellales bacterium]
MNEAHFAITVFIALLLVASGVVMATKWIRVPYTLALVIVGLVISPMHFLPVVHISPELILLIFLPALLFEASWNLKIDHLRENWRPILLLAVAGVILSVGVIGGIMHWAIGLSWSTALLFGAIISATDPVSVLALFKELGAPKRLNTIVEGESLFNDGTAVVVFRIILGIVIGATGMESTGGMLLSSLREFVVVVFGGLAVGALIGIAASTITSYFDDHLLEITLTTITAYGSFLAAESLHVSPVIAVLAAGMIIGNYGRARGMSPTTQVAVNSFWEYAAFVVNSLVFLLIGLEVQFAHLFDNKWMIAWAVAAMLIARMAAIYGLIPISNLLTEKIPFRWQHVLFWGGLRGSLSIALVLSLPVNLPGRQTLVALVFGTVIFSLLAQGLTIAPLLRRLGLGRQNTGMSEFELLQSDLLAEAAARAELEDMLNRGMITDRIYRSMHPELNARHSDLNAKLAEIDGIDAEIELQHRKRVLERLIHARKARLMFLLREGMMADETHRTLNEKLDRQLSEILGGH